MEEAGADGDNKKKSKGELAWERKQEEKRRAIAAIRRLPISGKLDAMAAAAQAVLADPDWHLAGIKPHDDREYAEFKRSRREGEKSKKELVGKWETLMLLANDAKPKVQRYAILSIVAVFKDVLPDYRIRLPTAKEREVRTTKEVRIQRKRERALLTTYQSYLKMLERLVQDASAPASVRAACVKAMCALFLEKPGFNFGANILKVLVPNMNSPIEAISEQCTACIATMFQTDANADSSLATVRAISKMVQAHKNGMDGKIRVGTIRTLLALPLSADLKNAARAMQAEKRKREAKKKKKKAKRRGQEDISKELAEANTAPDHIAKYTAQAQTLREVFLLYLRVLKRAPTSPLLPEVLEGVSKFIHLVNLDLARDLVNVMVELCDTRPERKYRLAPRAVMQCILTVGLALKGPGKELKVDEGAFLSALACCMSRAAQNATPKLPPPEDGVYDIPSSLGDELRRKGHPDALAPLALRCINTLFVTQRPRVSIATIVPVIKGALAIALSTSVHLSLALISMARTLIAAYPACKAALGISTAQTKREKDAETIDHLGFADDALVKQSGSAATPSGLLPWELASLRSHFHAKVRQSASALARDAPLPPNERPTIMMSEYDPSTGGFNPAVRAPQRRENQTSKRKKRRRTRRSRAYGDWTIAGGDIAVAKLDAEKAFRDHYGVIC